MKWQRITVFIMVLSCLLLGGCTGSTLSSNSEKEDNAIYPVEVDGKVDYINKSGTLVVEPQYDYGIQSAEIKALTYVGGTTMVLKENGELWLWGRNARGELGNGTWENNDIPKKLMDNVKMAECNGFVIAVTEKGELWTWGNNKWGELGDGTTLNKNRPQKIMDGVRIAKNAGTSTFALKENGELWAWGNNELGELGDGTKQNSSIPKKIMDNVKIIDTGSTTIYAIKENGELWAWGENCAGQVGNGTQEEGRSTPTKIMNDVKKVIGCGDVAYLIKENGELWGWGLNDYGEIGDGTTEISRVPKKVMDRVKEVNSSSSVSMALKENGELWVWGGRDLYDLAPAITKPVKALENVKTIINNDEDLVITENGELWDCSIIPAADGTNDNPFKPQKVMDNIKLAKSLGDSTIAVTGSNRLVFWDNDTLELTEIILGEQKEVVYR